MYQIELIEDNSRSYDDPSMTVRVRTGAAHIDILYKFSTDDRKDSTHHIGGDGLMPDYDLRVITAATTKLLDVFDESGEEMFADIFADENGDSTRIFELEIK